jgi:parvulin-like peptidyl-prolyl isomerase
MKQFILVIIIMACTLSVHAKGDSVLAVIGDVKVTVDEFRKRFELMPQVQKRGDINDIEEKKMDLLLSIIAEKMFAKEAEGKGYGESELMKKTFPLIEKMYVRDALYEREIKSKVKISEEELTEGVKRYFRDLQLLPVVSNDSAEIFHIYDQLQSGLKFDSLYLIQEPHIPPMIIKYDDFKNDIEEKLYSLNKGEYSEPIKAGGNWIIFQLNEIIERSYTSTDINAAIKKVDNILKERREGEIYKEFFRNFFSNKKGEVNYDLFSELADLAAETMEVRSKDSARVRKAIHLENSDLEVFESYFGEKADQEFVLFDKDNISLRDFLRSLFFEGFYSEEIDRDIIEKKLSSRVRLFIENELLAREGYSRGLQHLSEVASEINMWRSNYLSALMRKTLNDSLTYEGVPVFDKGLAEVNIEEILTDNLDQMAEVMDLLERGEDFKELAKKHSKREWTKEKGGEFGYFPVTMYGEIGRAAENMKPGEIYGPIKVNEGYSLFKLLDKREIKEGKLETEELKNLAKYRLMKEHYTNYAVKLAGKYNIKIEEGLLRGISLKDNLMLVIRYMGFGGRITAVPVTFPFHEWYRPWQESIKENP